jgi:hypothetical protein
MNAQATAEQLLAELKKQAKRKAVMAETEKAIWELEQKLYEQMDAEGVEAITLDGGGEEIKFSPKIEQDFSLNKDAVGTDKWDDAAVFLAWLKEKGLGDIIKMKESVHAATRKKVLKEYLDENGSLPEWIIQKFLNTISYNQSAINRVSLKEVQ